MKMCCFIVPGLLVFSLLLLACESSNKMIPRVRKPICDIARLLHTNANLLTRTRQHLKASFPEDNITSIQLLTNTLRTEFMRNCNVRHQMYHFYLNDILGSDLVKDTANKLNITEDFGNLQSLLHECNKFKCERLHKRYETSILDLKRKFNEIQGENRIYKAISEFEELFVWIRVYLYAEQSTVSGKRN